MGKIVGKIIKAGKNTFDHLDAKINFSIPQNLVSYYGVNGKKNDKDLKLTKDNFRLQIGKMEKNNETIYTKEILLPALEYIFRKLGENEKIIIQLRPDLAKFLTNENQKEKGNQILSFEEEKQKIISLIKKYFQKNAKKVEIVNVSDQYPEIFSLLENEGKDGLISKNEIELTKENLSALNLVKYICQKAQRNPKLMQLFYATKPDEQKKQDILSAGQNNSDYYSLVEVGIRLYEIISGISIQGGIDRQGKYDKIIGGILQRKDIDGFKTKDYPELKELHNFCKEVNPDFVFDRVWISTKGVREIKEKQQSLSKMKTVSLVAMASLLSLLGGYEFSQYIEKKKREEEKHDFFVKKLDPTSISFYGLSTNYKPGGNAKEKVKYLEDISKHMFNIVVEIYGNSGKIFENKEKILSVIQNELLRKAYSYETYDGDVVDVKNVEKFYKLPLDWSIIQIADFVVAELLPKNETIFKEFGVEPVPYNRFLQYKSDFDTLLGLEGKIELNSSLSGDFFDNSSGIDFKNRPVGGGFVSTGEKIYEKKYIGTYYDYRSYDGYHFVEIKTVDGKKIILASKGSVLYDQSGSQTYSLDIAKEGIKKLQLYRDKYM